MDKITPVFKLMMNDAEIIEWEGKFKRDERSLSIIFKEKEHKREGNN